MCCGRGSVWRSELKSGCILLPVKNGEDRFNGHSDPFVKTAFDEPPWDGLFLQSLHEPGLHFMADVSRGPPRSHSVRSMGSHFCHAPRSRRAEEIPMVIAAMDGLVRSGMSYRIFSVRISPPAFSISAMAARCMDKVALVEGRGTTDERGFSRMLLGRGYCAQVGFFGWG